MELIKHISARLGDIIIKTYLWLWKLLYCTLLDQHKTYHRNKASHAVFRNRSLSFKTQKLVLTHYPAFVCNLRDALKSCGCIVIIGLIRYPSLYRREFPLLVCRSVDTLKWLVHIEASAFLNLLAWDAPARCTYSKPNSVVKFSPLLISDIFPFLVCSHHDFLTSPTGWFHVVMIGWESLAWNSVYFKISKIKFGRSADVLEMVLIFLQVKHT